MRRAGSRLTSSPPRSAPRLVRARVSGDSSTTPSPLPLSTTVRQTPETATLSPIPSRSASPGLIPTAKRTPPCPEGTGSEISLPRSRMRPVNMTSATLSYVVMPAGDDRQLRLCGGIDQTVLIGDPARPVPRQSGSEGLWLADAFERTAEGVLDQRVDPLQQLAVMILEPEIVLPRRGRES